VDPSAASSLCQRCGLCCDGNLFTAVPVTAAEAAEARGRGLLVISRADGAAALRQRCAALGAGGCGVYAARPGPCRSYRCMLLTALMDDEVALADALATVDGARGRLAAAEAALPGEDAVLQRARRAGAAAPAAAREALAFVGRHFDRR
jgi:hypothetical protein